LQSIQLRVEASDVILDADREGINCIAAVSIVPNATALDDCKRERERKNKKGDGEGRLRCGGEDTKRKKSKTKLRPFALLGTPNIEAINNTHVVSTRRCDGRCAEGL
jgi:hypothetical protein